MGMRKRGNLQVLICKWLPSDHTNSQPLTSNSINLFYIVIALSSVLETDPLGASFFLALIFVGLFIWAFGLKNSYQNKYFSSDAWKTEVARATSVVKNKIYEEYLVRYQEALNEYNLARDKYNKEVWPEAQKKLIVWQKSQNAKIAVVEKDLDENIDALHTLYTSTQMVPSSYRSVERLTWLYEDMSTSEHDIERSIDLLNSKEIKDELINIQGQVDEMRSDLRAGFVGVYEAIQDGNSIQSEMLSNLDSIRRSARIGNFMNVGNLLQNHSRNKMLSQISNSINK